jgi:hypothetical protein
MTLPAAGDPQTASIIVLVSSISVAVDLRNFDLAEAAFAPSLLVDYTSLWGGEAQRTTPAALIAGWRSLLPGFDATHHELSNIEVNVDGDGASSSVMVDARHWIGSALWRLVGTQYFTLERTDGRWRVVSMKLVVNEEIGDRGLVNVAAGRAKRA